MTSDEYHLADEALILTDGQEVFGTLFYVFPIERSGFEFQAFAPEISGFELCGVRLTRDQLIAMCGDEFWTKESGIDHLRYEAAA